MLRASIFLTLMECCGLIRIKNNYSEKYDYVKSLSNDVFYSSIIWPRQRTRFGWVCIEFTRLKNNKIIIIASHDNEMNDVYNDKIYMRRNDTVE